MSTQKGQSTTIPHPYSELICLYCKGQLDTTLSESNLHCVNCGQSYPQTINGIHAIFQRPPQAIARAYLQLYNVIQQGQKQIDRLSETLKSSQRKQTLLPILKAHSDNQAIFSEWGKRLENHVQPSALLEVRTNAKLSAYGYNFAYLQRDWSTEPSGQAEIESQFNAIKRALRLTDIRGRALVLGMGTGRFGVQLRNYFEDIWAIDSSFGQVLQYSELLKKEITFWNINSKNQLTKNTMAHKVTAVIPEHLKEQSLCVNYVWADVLQNPFRDHFFDFVFSIYFSDVIPLPDLIKEVKRLLRPNGYFLHIGPLEYHFNDIEHHYSFDEFREHFREHGFEVIHESSSCSPEQMMNKQSLASNRLYTNKILLVKLITKDNNGEANNE